MEQTETFITFPDQNRITLAAGTIAIDFRNGIAILPDGTQRKLSKRASKERPLKYVYFSTSQDTNVIITLNSDAQYSGIIPAGEFDIHNITFDHITITTTTATSMFMIASTSPSTVSWQKGLPVKSTTTLIPITAVAANAQSQSDELDISLVDRMNIFIDHARDDANAFIGAGTEYRVLVSKEDSGNNGWVPLYSLVAGITAPTSMVTDGAEAAASTVIECGAAVPALGQYVFFKNAVLQRSEWGKVAARNVGVGTESVTLLHGLTYAQAQGTYYDQAEKFALSFDVRGYKRIVVVCNNNNGTTNRNMIWQCKATTQRW